MASTNLPRKGQHVQYDEVLRESSANNRRPVTQSTPAGLKLLHSKWGGRHPTRLSDAQSPERAASSDPKTQNYFEEFRESVQRIRDQGQAPVHTNSGADNSNQKTNEPLWVRIQRQNQEIDRLELSVRELRTAQQNEERRHELEVNNLKAQLRSQNRSMRESQVPPAHSQFPMVHEAEMNELRSENVSLQKRTREIADRARVLALMHQHRVEMLEAKLQTSLSINQHYLNHSSHSYIEEDSTMELINGVDENTTAILLRENTEQRFLGHKSRLRACILAVLFTARIRRQAHAEREWRIKVMNEISEIK